MPQTSADAPNDPSPEDDLREVARLLGRIARRHDPGHAMRVLRDAKPLLDHSLTSAVIAARGAGYSWSEVAEALNVSKQGAYDKYRAVDPAAPLDEHQRRRLTVAADWAITTASRQLRATLTTTSDVPPVAVTVQDVIGRAADDGLTVTRADAAAALRQRFTLRGGGLGLVTDAFNDGGKSPKTR
jgi:hypothetical protein